VSSLVNSAVNVVLPAFAAAAPAVQQSIDISFPPGPQQQTRRTLLQLANGREKEGQTDRWTDTVPLHRSCSAGSGNEANVKV